MNLSIVSTMYHSASHLEEFYRRICASAEKVTSDFEIVLVNDGSPDDSLKIALDLVEKDSRVIVLDLSRNFGHHEAILAGFTHTGGDYVFLIDCDLEEPPELLEQFWNELNQFENTDVVYGFQEKRKGGLFERATGAVFYNLLHLMTDLNFRKNILIVRLMTRRYVEAVLLFEETELFLAGILELAGFSQKAIPVKKRSRGASSYTFRKKIRQVANAVTSFSVMPLQLIFVFGTLISLGAVVFAIYLVVRKFYVPEIELGWTSVVVSIWFFGGIMTMFMGVLGLYLARIYREVKKRPRTILKAIHKKHPSNNKIDQHDAHTTTEG